MKEGHFPLEVGGKGAHLDPCPKSTKSAMTISCLDVQVCGERGEELLYSGLFFKVFSFCFLLK